MARKMDWFETNAHQYVSKYMFYISVNLHITIFEGMRLYKIGLDN